MGLSAAYMKNTSKGLILQDYKLQKRYKGIDVCEEVFVEGRCCLCQSAQRKPGPQLREEHMAGKQCI